MASSDTFSNLDFKFRTLENRLRELAFLNSGVRIELMDKRSENNVLSELHYEGGVCEFVKYLDNSHVLLDCLKSLVVCSHHPIVCFLSTQPLGCTLVPRLSDNL